MTNWMWLAAAVWLAGCAKDNKVSVSCVGTGTAIECTTTHTSGDKRLSPCWDYVVTCENGTRVWARACSKVDPEGVVSTTIPISKMKNAAECDTVASRTVENINVAVSP